MLNASTEKNTLCIKGLSRVLLAISLSVVLVQHNSGQVWNKRMVLVAMMMAKSSSHTFD